MKMRREHGIFVDEMIDRATEIAENIKLRYGLDASIEDEGQSIVIKAEDHNRGIQFVYSVRIGILREEDVIHSKGFAGQR